MGTMQTSALALAESMFRGSLLAMLAGVLALAMVASALAQEGTPATPAELEALEVTLTNVEGEEVGVFSFHREEGYPAVRITGDVDGFEPGDHGIHIHETGVCDPSGDEPFSSAGGHFNPTGASHGPGPLLGATPSVATPVSDAQDAHAGDLGNIAVGEDGNGSFDIATERVSLEAGAENSLNDEDGSAIVIHADPDDLQTDPSGESGDRIACGVIFAPSDEG